MSVVTSLTPEQQAALVAQLTGAVPDLGSASVDSAPKGWSTASIGTVSDIEEQAAENLGLLADYKEALKESNSRATIEEPGGISYTPEELDDTEAKQFLGSCTQDSKYQPLDFEHPLELLCLIDENIQSGRITPYLWQVETSELLGKKCYTQDSPLRFFLRASNGSGKDAYVVSPFAVWFICTKIRAKVIITSCSYSQLKTQTEADIRKHCFAANIKFRELGLSDRAFIVKKEHIVCTLTGSEIIMFATDDPGRAEGHHPYSDYPNAEMAVIMNEVKTLDPAIIDALGRCTGFNYWVCVSSPGNASGYFHERCTSETTTSYPKPYVHGVTEDYHRKVTVYDCPHFGEKEIEYARRTKRPFIFGSQYMAEFGSDSEEVLIPLDRFNRYLLEQPPHDGRADPVGGLDLSMGGDESTLATRRGNMLSELDAFRLNDTPTIYINNLLLKRGYIKKKYPIFTDVGGLGLPIAKDLRAMGWNIVFRLNNRQATRNEMYASGGCEDWFDLSTLLFENSIILAPPGKKIDETLRRQLTTRMYSRPNNDKIVIESKKDMKKRGVSSPDRADAVVLCFINFQPMKSIEYINKRNEELLKHGRITQDKLLEVFNEKRFAGFNERTQFDGKTVKKQFNIGKKRSTQDTLLLHHLRNSGVEPKQLVYHYEESAEKSI